MRPPRAGFVEVLPSSGGVEVAGPPVKIGGRVYPSVYAAEHKWAQARRATRNPFKKLLATAVLLELKAVQL